MIILHPRPPRRPVCVAGEFKTCTILFSDVVTFTNICAACEPIQIVNMLNSMYSRFDRLTSIHEVYKVRHLHPWGMEGAAGRALRVDGCPHLLHRQELGHRSPFASISAGLAWVGMG